MQKKKKVSKTNTSERDRGDARKIPGADHCGATRTVIDVLTMGTPEEKAELRRRILSSSHFP